MGFGKKVTKYKTQNSHKPPGHEQQFTCLTNIVYQNFQKDFIILTLFGKLLHALHQVETPL